jgi:hypothetical protein
MASAMNNVPLVFKRPSRTLLLRIASSAALQILESIAARGAPLSMQAVGAQFSSEKTNH